MKICIAEDNPDKLHHIVQVLTTKAAVSVEDIFVAHNLAEARKHLSQIQFDLLVLDISLPPDLTSKPAAEAGIGFLREIQSSLRLRKPLQIVGLTAYEELLHKCAVAFSTFTWTLLHYRSDDVSWEDRLVSKVVYCREMSSSKLTDATFDYDVGIITALHSPELLAVLNLPIKWELSIKNGDYSEYFIGKVVSQSRSYRVVAASAIQMGSCSAAVLTSKLIANFRPKLVAMCGISAGVRGRCELGDILIADSSWDYGSGKIVSEQGQRSFQPDPKYISMTPDLQQILERVAAQKLFLSNIVYRWPGLSAKTPLAARIGPMASGSAVVQDETLVRSIVDGNRKLLGLEMETYGVYFAARHATKPLPLFFSAKSVCDFADSHKGDDHQAYAAFTSANYVYELILNDVFAQLLE